MQLPAHLLTQTKLRLILLGLFVCISSLSITAIADNKVVVIPMADNYITPEPVEPVAPLTAHSPPSSAYNIGTVTVSDKITGLQWQREDDNTTRNWDAAWAHCAGLALGGKSDWRLPSIKELQSIVSYGDSSPAINSTVFPNTNPSAYWSASAVAANLGHSWLIGFSTGYRGYNNVGANYVRCVR